MNKKEIKNSAQFWAAIVIVIFGCVLVAYACKTPPPGEIHPSILGVFGEILTWSGTILGIDYHYKHKKSNDNETHS